jgi:hypothetical protein
MSKQLFDPCNEKQCKMTCCPECEGVGVLYKDQYGSYYSNSERKASKNSELVFGAISCPKCCGTGEVVDEAYYNNLEAEKSAKDEEKMLVKVYKER